MQWYQTREFTEGIYNLINVISKHIKMQGFMISSYFHLYPKFPEMTLNQIEQGKLVYISVKPVKHLNLKFQKKWQNSNLLE